MNHNDTTSSSAEHDWSYVTYTSGSLYEGLSQETIAEIEEIAQIFGVSARDALNAWQKLQAYFADSFADAFASFAERLKDLWGNWQDLMTLFNSCATPRPAYQPVMIGNKLTTKRRFDTHCQKRLFLYPACTHHTTLAGWGARSLPKIHHH